MVPVFEEDVAAEVHGWAEDAVVGVAREKCRLDSSDEPPVICRVETMVEYCLSTASSNLFQGAQLFMWHKLSINFRIAQHSCCCSDTILDTKPQQFTSRRVQSLELNGHEKYNAQFRVCCIARI